MSKYLNKKAVLESIGEAYQTNLESPDQTDWDEGYRSALRFMERTVLSGAFDAPEPDWRSRTMTDREKKIAEIREALERATPGTWKWIDAGGYERKKLVGEYEIMNFGASMPYSEVAGQEPDDADAHLIANAPEWLRFLLSELERKDEVIEEQKRELFYKSKEITELREKSWQDQQWFKQASANITEMQKELDRIEREYAEERAAHNAHVKIGRASCRERGKISGEGGSSQRQNRESRD